MLLTACSRLSEIGAMKFIEEDSAYLLRRIPAQVKAEHYHSDEVHIRDLLEESGLTPRGGIALAAATIRGLILTVSHQEQIGALYPQVLETLTRGACEELFPRGVNAACGFFSLEVRDVELKTKQGGICRVQASYRISEKRNEQDVPAAMEIFKR